MKDNYFRTKARYRDSWHGTFWATGWTIGVLGFDFRRGVWIFLFTVASRRALGPTQPPIQWVPCAGGKAAWVWI